MSSSPWPRAGRTPYTLALAAAPGSRRCGRRDRDGGGTPLAELADVAVEVAVGPEVLRGSTRLGAGTAQKVALNTLTTAAMVRLGRVHGDLMVDVVAANAKLRDRAAAVVAEAAGCDRRAHAQHWRPAAATPGRLCSAWSQEPARTGRPHWPRRIARCAKRWTPANQRPEASPTRCVLVTEATRLAGGLDIANGLAQCTDLSTPSPRAASAEPAADNGGEREAHR